MWSRPPPTQACPILRTIKFLKFFTLHIPIFSISLPFFEYHTQRAHRNINFEVITVYYVYSPLKFCSNFLLWSQPHQARISYKHFSRFFKCSIKLFFLFFFHHLFQSLRFHCLNRGVSQCVRFTKARIILFVLSVWNRFSAYLCQVTNPRVILALYPAIYIHTRWLTSYRKILPLWTIPNCSCSPSAKFVFANDSQSSL